MTDRRSLLLALPALAAASAPSLALAQEGRPARLLVGFPPGGSLDVIGRLLAARLNATGQPVMVENRAGAGGLVAAEALTTSPPDGSVLMAAPIVVSAFFPFVHKRLTFDPLKDLAPVTMLGLFNFALVVRADHPAKTLDEFVAWARVTGEPVNFGSISPGTPSHFLGVMFNRIAGTRMTHVPYRGSSPLQAALLAGEVHCAFDTTVSTIGQIRDGAMRALAVTGRTRSPTLPDVPSFAEAGPPLAEMAGAEFWYGLYAPGRTPGEVTRRWSEVVGTVLREPATAARLRDMDLEPRPMSPEAFGAVIAADAARWEPVIRASGFTAND
ncbi:Bug family tripartite tricarboxylate transporter substrate binding protein [Pararoseomonas indoligenes]|uniref:Tripartite tricarboxylate transporter substrate binding protein n=1 Tax=Roseomonas indoligenes TaxID=2820811 RepID=A0A940MXE9_9PROT|nr:tripartite tricarboxylate transporter substrate-binding protein [Pararoseomonas indoligenes]MBP0493866.1 tripartite tricarboxylate transporter substrate binding protein [Pararoseomonas indoligenes]